MNIPNTKTIQIMAFVPSGPDYPTSLEFYSDLGFNIEWKSPELSVMELHGQRFYLQNFANEELQGNFMMNLEVENVDDWWLHISSLNLQNKYPGIKLKPPQDYPWGKREIHLIDPAGVLWHIAMLIPD